MIWKDKNGKILSCFEKIKILDQNLDELFNLNLSFSEIQNSDSYKYALEDAMLFNITKEYFDENLQNYLHHKMFQLNL